MRGGTVVGVQCVLFRQILYLSLIIRCIRLVSNVAEMCPSVDRMGRMLQARRNIERLSLIY